MTTAWTLPVSDIIKDALEHLNVVAAGETPDADDQAIALTALQNILKELPLHGFSWGKITAPASALTWSAGSPSIIPMPADYFGAPSIYYVQNGANVRLNIISKAEYDAIPQPGYVALYPQFVYIAPNNVGYLWPVPSADPLLKITYQAIVSDAVLGSSPDVIQAWTGGLGIWLAYELLTKFHVANNQTINEIKEKYAIKRRMMLAYSAETSPITFSVAD